MKIAIISFFHTESSLCLAKYMAKQGVTVDYYFITDFVHDVGFQPGIKYENASKLLGLNRLSKDDAPEIINYTEGLQVTYNLLRLFWFSNKSKPVNYFIWKFAIRHIRKQHYDAIDIVGQWPWVKYLHDGLRDEKIVHTLHEVGSHQNGNMSTPLLKAIIKDRTPIIFHSKSTLSRFLAIEGTTEIRTGIIPFGKFETALLYERDVEIKHNLDLSKPTFLFYGYIKPYKGLDILAESMKLLTPVHHQFNLIVAGGGQDINISYFKSLRNCYVLNRFLTNDEMMKLIRISSVVVLPYHSASQSGIIPTCFMLGKPVIATKVGAFVENVKDGYNGILVEPESSKGFAEAMHKVYGTPDMIKKLSDGAFRYGHGDDYDWNTIAQQTINFLMK